MEQVHTRELKRANAENLRLAKEKMAKEKMLAKLRKHYPPPDEKKLAQMEELKNLIEKVIGTCAREDEIKI